MNAFSSSVYWEQRYRAGGHSGAGSCGQLAAFKAGVINGFVTDNAIADVLDLGCGDGHLLSLLQVPGTMSAWTCPLPRWHVASRGFRSTAFWHSPHWTQRSAPISCCRST